MINGEQFQGYPAEKDASPGPFAGVLRQAAKSQTAPPPRVLITPYIPPDNPQAVAYFKRQVFSSEDHLNYRQQAIISCLANALSVPDIIDWMQRTRQLYTDDGQPVQPKRIQKDINRINIVMQPDQKRKWFVRSISRIIGLADIPPEIPPEAPKRKGVYDPEYELHKVFAESEIEDNERAVINLAVRGWATPNIVEETGLKLGYVNRALETNQGTFRTPRARLPAYLLGISYALPQPPIPHLSR